MRSIWGSHLTIQLRRSAVHNLARPYMHCLPPDTIRLSLCWLVSHSRPWSLVFISTSFVLGLSYKWCSLHLVENNGAVATALHRNPLASPPCGTLLRHFLAVVSYSAWLGKGAARIKMSDERVLLQPYWENQSVRATAKASRSIKYTAWRSLT